MKENLTPQQEKMIIEQKIKGMQRTIREQRQKIREIESVVDNWATENEPLVITFRAELEEILFN